MEASRGNRAVVEEHQGRAKTTIGAAFHERQALAQARYIVLIIHGIRDREC